jgi:UDP-N-acetylglucosamine diphosphorylase / glucose-1-phosphate thymidylyltransferase / UDP-N-acetylgalactosamine diphosphorylase / glucosamine-1-phosphate N-acetyltransferase / galactosamine-1-phosphate N-acetyltransferase
MTDYDLVLFDDMVARDWMPFTLTRPAGELLFGTLRLRERAERVLRSTCIGHVTHPALIGFDEPSAPPVIDLAALPTTRARLFLLSRAVLDWDEDDADLDGALTLMLGDDEVIGWLVPAGEPHPSEEQLMNLQPGPGEQRVLAGLAYSSIAQLLLQNPDQILDDVAYMIEDVYSHEIDEDGVYVIGEHPVIRRSDVVIEPGVVFDVTEGPVWLEEGVTIKAFSRIAGPMYVGRSSTLLGGPYSGSSIGPHAKIHGELEACIILGYSNKAHDGFLGHAYLGMWVNLGAMTTNSDLKNNYSTIRIWTPQGEVDTKQMKLGAFLGDHVKTAIGTLLNTGTVIGAGANVFGGMPPKYLPPFSWGADGEYAFDKFIQTASVAMQRRNVQLSNSQRDMLARAWNRGRERQ